MARASYSDGVGCACLAPRIRRETGPLTTEVDVVAASPRVFRLLIPISIFVLAQPLRWAKTKHEFSHCQHIDAKIFPRVHSNDTSDAPTASTQARLQAASEVASRACRRASSTRKKISECANSTFVFRVAACTSTGIPSTSTCKQRTRRAVLRRASTPAEAPSARCAEVGRGDGDFLRRNIENAQTARTRTVATRGHGRSQSGYHQVGQVFGATCGASVVDAGSRAPMCGGARSVAAIGGGRKRHRPHEAAGPEAAQRVEPMLSVRLPPAPRRSRSGRAIRPSGSGRPVPARRSSLRRTHLR